MVEEHTGLALLDQLPRREINLGCEFGGTRRILRAC